MEVTPIGFIESCYIDKFGTPRQPGLVADSWSKLKINGIWQPQEALDGLQEFSHCWIIFNFHANTNKKYHAKIHPPRLGGKTIGVFATRSPHRPNPIGLSLVKIEKIEGDTIYFSGADLIDGTPILDLKPYLKEIESKPDAISGWTHQAPTQHWEVVFEELPMQTLTEWKNIYPQINLQSLIEETLKLDPRPLVYRGHEGKEKSDQPYRDTHAVRILNGDIHFKFTNQNQIIVFKILLEEKK